jgi:hypothetical protein
MEFLVLCACLVLGYSCSYKTLGIRQPFFAACFSLPIGSLSLLCLVNAMLRIGVELDSSLAASSILLLGAAIWIWRKPNLEALPSVAKRHVWAVMALTLVVFLHTNLARNQSGDDDYWIHTPLQALLARGVIPISHPYFSDIPMNGHYGRNLMIAILVKLTGWNVFAIEAWHTGVIQALTAALLWWSVYSLSVRPDVADETGHSAAMAYGAVLWVYLGINVGGRMGLLDTYQNNNGQVYLEVVLIAYLLYRVWRQSHPALVGLTSLLLGGFAIVYETHFGLLALGILALAVGCLKQNRRAVLPVLLTLVISALVAATQGGPFTSLAQRIMSPAHREYSVGEMNQHQVVTLRFPKQKLFQIQLGYGNYQRLSSASQVFLTPESWRKIQEGTPYCYVWNPGVLKIHWIVTWMAPLSLMFAIRSRQSFLALYWLMGTISYLVPAVVDFGPVYEFEYFRWEFAAGFFYAVAFGGMLGHLLMTAKRGGRLRQSLAYLGVSIVAFVSFTPCYRLHIRGTLQSFRPGRLLPLKSHAWLREHADSLRISPVDLRIATQLRAASASHERMLTNFLESDPSSILAESTFVGLSGVQSVGHALPLEEEPVGTPPFHMAPAARAFWHCFDPVILEQLKVDWVYVHPGPEIRSDSVSRLNELPFLKQVYAEDGYRLYKVVRPLPAVSGRPAEGVQAENFAIDFGRLEKPLPPKVCLAGSFVAKSPIQGVFRYRFVSEENYPHSDLDWVYFSRCGPGEIPVVTPQHQGKYHLELFSNASERCLWKSPVVVVKQL